MSATGPTRLWPCNGANPSPFHPGPRSPLRDIHLVGDRAEMIKVDLAHTFAIAGFGKDHLASTLIFVAVRCKYFGGSNFPTQLSKAFDAFSIWCAQNKRYTTIRSFDKTELKIVSLPGHDFIIFLKQIHGSTNSPDVFPSCSPLAFASSG